MVVEPPRDESRPTARLVARGLRIFLRSLRKPIPVARKSSRGYSDRNRLPDVHALSVVHTELVLIHPFREGNGRVARMLATLMGLQSELPPLGFGKMGGDYRPMEKIFSAAIRRTLRRQA
jgi:cell filamentation protein